MNIEQQVISLDFAKKLKELNVKQSSYFYYCFSTRLDKYFIHTINEFKNHDKSEDFLIKEYSAFTCVELGALLPREITEDGKRLFLQLGWESDSIWRLYYRDFDIPIDHHDMFKSENEANCRAKILIYLIENNLMGVPK